jgi:lipoteichoic acid synthase
VLYDNQSDYLTKDEIAEANIYRENAEKKLSLSDRVVNGDLLRFYTPENFMPTDHNMTITILKTKIYLYDR